jgi:hypothetical protein
MPIIQQLNTPHRFSFAVVFFISGYKHGIQMNSQGVIKRIE